MSFNTPKFYETATEVKQTPDTEGKDLSLQSKLKLMDNGILRFNGGRLEFSFDAGLRWYEIGDKIKAWISARSYIVGDFAIESGILYRCTTANSDSTFISDNWEKLGGGSSGGGSALTGLLTGGNLTIGANNTSVDVSALEARIVDDWTDPNSPTTYPVIVGASNVPITNVATSGLTYLYVDKTGAFVQSANQLSTESMRDHVLLGAVIHTVGGVVNAINNVTEGVTFSIGRAFLDLQRWLGPQNFAGNVFTPNATNPLGFDKSAGKILFFGGNSKVNRKDENVADSPALTNPFFFLTYRGATPSTWSNVQTQSIVPNRYDNGTGTLAVVANNKWKADQVYLVQSGIVVQYAQNIYNSRGEAIVALGREPFSLNPDLAENAVFVGWLVTSGASTSWASGDLLLSSTFSAGSSPSVTFSNWSVVNVTAAMSPYTVTQSRQHILVDASAGAVTVKLQDVSSSTADRETRIYLTANTNPVTVTTVGGTQAIGNGTTQTIDSKDEGFSVVADFANLKYVITQDNRKETTFKIEQSTWAYFKNYPDIDFANSNLVGGFLPTGDSHKVNVVTGTDSGAFFVSKPVFSVEEIKEINWFFYMFTCSHDGAFKVVIQGFNGSTWTDLTTSEPYAREKNTTAAQFSLASWAAFRIKVAQIGTTAGRTLTISRGEWTDQFSKIVEVSDESYSSKLYSSTANGSISTRVMAFISGDINIENDLYKIETTAALGTVLTVKKECLLGSSLTYTSATGGIEFGVVKNAVPTTVPQSQDKANILALGIMQTAGYETNADHSPVKLVAGDKIYPMAEIAGSDTTGNLCVWTITATPIGKQRGYTATADVDLSQYGYPQYDISSYINGAASVVKATGTPYKTPDGNIRFRFFFDVAMTAASRASATYTIDSVAPLSSAGESQPIEAISNQLVSFYRAYANTSGFIFEHATATTSFYRMSGDIELSSWPTWATKKSFVVQNMIAPIAVQYPTETKILASNVAATGDIASLTFTGLEIGAEYELGGQVSITTPSSGARSIYLAYRSGAGATGELYGRTSLYNNNSMEVESIVGVNTRFIASSSTMYVNLQKSETTGQLQGTGGKDRTFLQLTRRNSTGMIASSTAAVHQYAVRASATESEAGYCEFTGKKIYKKSFRWTGSSSGSIQLGNIPANSEVISIESALKRSDGLFFPSYTASGSSLEYYVPVVDASTGGVSISMSGPTITMARVTIYYTKP